MAWNDLTKPRVDLIPGQYKDAPEPENTEDQEKQEDIADISYDSSILRLSSDDKGFMEVTLSGKNDNNCIFLLEPRNEEDIVNIEEDAEEFDLI